MVVGFTGTRQGLTVAQRARLRDRIQRLRTDGGPNEFHHGDCVGADEQAAALAREAGFVVHRHPPSAFVHRAYTPFDVDHPPRDYMERNADVVAACTVLLACPKSTKEELRSGTWATVRRARLAGRPVIVVRPDGSTG